MGAVKKITNTDASSIIKDKLISSNGKTTIYTYNGTPYDIYLTEDGECFTCIALPGVLYKFKVFNDIVALLIREGGKAKKGYARGKHDKVGTEKCNEHTATGIIALEYFGKSIGDSVFDPVFILAGILEWADIAKNERGYLELTTNYRELVNFRV